MGKREQIVNTAIRYNGMPFKGGSHRTLIDEFNKHKPDGWAMTYTANFCAACASAIAYLCGVGDAYPCSANVGTIVAKAQRMGIWVESDSYVPSPGDWIIYAWQDSGRGDSTTGASHVGIVVSAGGGYINVFEFNIHNNHSTGYRKIAVNGRFIRGFVSPKFQTYGWIQDEHGWWFKNKDGSYPKNKWESIDGAWYYFDSSGYAVTGWNEIDDKWYYFNSYCKMVTGWQNINGKWFYLGSDGSLYINGLHEINGKNYYFDKDGVMCTGWIKVNDDWQYFNADGSRVEKGIVKGDSVYIIKDGKLVTDDTVTVEANQNGEVSVV
ncbi:MAG: N-acetylmuramoyl-L-alanine amidase family protein [Mogibacterium diversum]|uniref:hypothetical protein n=1 Tax=Mogibacterium diversum TaxID=114527 RepID=UPI001CAB0C24|nr:hypothetical protein [Mogibacterium diversum]MBF1340740.1 N-acetylmuramoyl-L-alanine amidase family protein [Mogibacterium diversum]